MRRFAVALLALGALLAGGCGSDDKESGDKAKTTDADGPNGKIRVVYAPPQDVVGRQAMEILRLGGTDGVAAGFTQRLKLPHNLKINVVNGFVGPN
ncbi:MAG: hypothetical protein ACRDKY_02875, partial [Solirubrobacteraceae bacterium]